MFDLNEMFVEMFEADGFEAWFECESEWDRYEAAMVAAGVDADEAEDFFSQMCEDL